MRAILRSQPTVIASALALIAVLLSLLVRTSIPVNHDVSWFLVAAERMLAGGTYVNDFFEVNMPLAIAIYVPVVAVDSLLHTGLAEAVALWTLLLTLQTLWLVWMTLKFHAFQHGDERFRHVAFAWIAIVVAVLPAYEFAEREHYVSLLLLPLIVLLSHGTERAPRRLETYACLMAALGAFLKPHFAILPLLLTGLSATMAGAGSARRKRSIQMFVIVLAAGIANAIWVSTMYPGWFEVMSWAGDLYGEYQGHDPARFLSQTSAMPALGCILLLAAVYMTQAASRRALWPFLLAALYCWAIFFLQGKGWRYHLLPAAIISASAVPWVWIRTAGTDGSRAPPWVWRGLLAFAGASVLWSGISAHRQTPRISDFELSLVGQLLSVTRPGDSLHAISTSAVPFFPAVTHYKLKWASRLSALWPLAALGRYEVLLDDRSSQMMRRYKEPFAAMVAGDIARHKPDLILVDRRPGQFGLPRGFDMLAYFRQSRSFRHAWSRYQLMGRNAEFELYARTVE